MDLIPHKIYRQLFIYLLPTICITATNNILLHPPYLFFQAILSSLIPPLLPSKTSLIISSVLFFISIISPGFYYFSYGFIISHIYNSRILISSARASLHLFIFKVELISFIFSKTIYIPIQLQLIIGVVILLISIWVDPPASESSDPYTAMKNLIVNDRKFPFVQNNSINYGLDSPTELLIKNPKKISSKKILEEKYHNKKSLKIDPNILRYSALLSQEYKMYVKGKLETLMEKLKPMLKPDFGLFYFINLTSGFKLWSHIFIFMNIFHCRFTIFIMVSFILIFEFYWEWLAIFGKFSLSDVVSWRMATGYGLYLLIIFILKYMSFNVYTNIFFN